MSAISSELTHIVGGPSAGSITNLDLPSIDLVVRPDPYLRAFLAPAPLSADQAGEIYKVSYRRHLFRMQDGRGFSVDIPVYAPIDWSTKDLLHELLTTYRKHHQ